MVSPRKATLHKDLLLHVVLLWADDGARPTHPDPADHLGRCEFEVFHHVAPNQGSRPPKASWEGRRKSQLQEMRIGQPLS